jgi:hypothetical protein
MIRFGNIWKHYVKIKFLLCRRVLAARGLCPLDSYKEAAVGLPAPHPAKESRLLGRKGKGCPRGYAAGALLMKVFF